MKTTHTTMIHGECPNGGWDYYTVEYTPRDFVQVEDFEFACDGVRGLRKFQEAIAERLAEQLPAGMLSIIGRHGLNTDTRVELEVL